MFTFIKIFIFYTPWIFFLYYIIVNICHSSKSIKKLLESFKEDKSHLVHDYLISYPSPRIIVHGKDYDRTYKYYYKEPEEDNNKYNLNLEEMD